MTGAVPRKRTSWTLVALASLALVAVWLVSPPAADAYPDPVCNASVRAAAPAGSGNFTVTGTSNVSRHWVMTYQSQVATGTGKKFTHTFKAGTKAGAKSVKIDCGGGLTQDVPVTPHHPTTDTQANASPPVDHNGVLPGTGGPSFWILLVGLILTTGGYASIRSSRKSQA
jgi:hypothetical protein